MSSQVLVNLKQIILNEQCTIMLKEELLINSLQSIVTNSNVFDTGTFLKILIVFSRQLNEFIHRKLNNIINLFLWLINLSNNKSHFLHSKLALPSYYLPPKVAFNIVHTDFSFTLNPSCGKIQRANDVKNNQLVPLCAGTCSIMNWTQRPDQKVEMLTEQHRALVPSITSKSSHSSRRHSASAGVSPAFFSQTSQRMEKSWSSLPTTTKRKKKET